MATTVKAILRESKQKDDGTAPVWIRITANRRSRYVSTGVYVKPKHWNANKQKVRTSHPIAPTLNDKLQSVLIDAKTEALDADTAAQVKAALVGSGGSLTRFIQEYIEGLDEAGRFWQWKKFRVTLGKLQDCFGRERISWKDLNGKALQDFETFLREEVGNATNTIRKEMQRLHRVVKQAVKEEVIKPEDDPFLTYDSPKREKPNRRKLSLDEIEALHNVELEEGTTAHKARDAFLFAFYAGGMRFGDLCRIKGKHLTGLESGSPRVEYRTAKNGTPISAPLPPPAVELVEHYQAREHYRGPESFLFPLLEPGDDSGPVKVRRKIGSKNALVNRYLKEVAERAEIESEGLSTHVARHSFADYARRKSGDLYAISKSLGHKNLQTTEQYLKSCDRDAVDELADDLWN
jgi:integrase